MPPPVSLGTRVALSFDATQEQVYKTFHAIAKLADQCEGGKMKLRVERASAAGFEPSWLRNAVQEPLEEANIKANWED